MFLDITGIIRARVGYPFALVALVVVVGGVERILW